MTNNQDQHQPDGDGLREALKTAVRHIEHMAHWIGKQNAGYSFEGLGEDMCNIYAVLSAPPKPAPDAVREAADPSRNDLIESIQYAIGTISMHIQAHHDGDYEPHQVPAELEELRRIQHHLEGSLISFKGEYAAIAAPVPSPDGASDLLSLVTEIICRFQNDERTLYPDNEVLIALDQIRCAIGSPSPAVAAEPDLPKRPFAFAVRRAPENGADAWRLFMDEGEAREAAEQLDGDYEALYRVGDRRSAIQALLATPPVRGDREALAQAYALHRWKEKLENLPDDMKDDCYNFTTATERNCQ